MTRVALVYGAKFGIFKSGKIVVRHLLADEILVQDDGTHYTSYCIISAVQLLN